MGNTLSPLSGTGGLLQIIIANPAFGTVTLMRQIVDGQPVVRFEVTVAARKSNTETRHSPIQPFVVALHKDLPVPVAHTTAADLNCFAIPLHTTNGSVIQVGLILCVQGASCLHSDGLDLDLQELGIGRLPPISW